MAKKEKLGLMSRKMMLLRSRTASGGQGEVPEVSRSSYSQGSSAQSNFIPSSPILQDVGNLAPERPELLQLPLADTDRRSASGGSSSSDISGMAAFLAKYEKKDGASDDETFLYQNDDDSGTVTEEEGEYNAAMDSEMDAERRKQQLEEYNSAILSKRAEQILANAKKRLNVMEGNLRGARDLVAPLTAANLKRATSLGSAQYVPTHSRRQASNGYDYDENQQQHVLQTQSSSPAMGRDYYSHARGFSETELPERSQTALGHPYDAYHNTSRNVHAAGLRSARSHDMLGGYGARPLHVESPDSAASGYLEPLQEADETRRSYREIGQRSMNRSINSGLGIYTRPSSRTSDLREQMSSLKGKISNLKERAREESLRRQSESNLRKASPFNNAMANAPEFYYTSSSSGYGSPVHDTNAGAGRTSASNSPASAHFPNTTSDNRAAGTGSRNAFAEQAAAQKQHGTQQARVVDVPTSTRSKSQAGQNKDLTTLPAGTVHRRTTSGTAIIESARNRYSHHQQQPGQAMPGAFIDDYEDEDAYLEVPPPVLTSEHYLSSSNSSSGSSGSRPSPHIDDDNASEDGTSVYEDAKNDQASVVAHEDREDAFDYENFFLHSAMGSYSGDRRGSDSSETSASSVETAKGPTLLGHEEEGYDDEDFDDRTAEFPPPTPETPERLREIEANLHKRSFSDESISTLATYATADEAMSSPTDEMGRTISPPVLSPTFSERNRAYAQPTVQRPLSRPNSRPSTAVHVNRALPSDSSSDRADSGVGLPRRAIPLPSSMTPKARKPTVTSAITPPTSPRVHQDPAALAVTALLDADAPPLGLRNKAVLFSVVESLRKVVKQLQELDETSYDSRELRGRLDEAKYMLDGRGES